MDAIYENRDSISAVVFWGTTDDQSWRADRLPLLFNEDYTAKPCFYSIIDGIDYTTTESTATTSKSTETTTSTTSSTSDSGTTGKTAVRGDADENGAVELRDAISLAKAIAGTEDLSVQGAKNCDLDGEAGLSGGDLTVMLQYLAGSIDTL